jgi:hypothetical protein
VYQTYPSKLLAKIRSQASTSPKKKTGRPKVYGQQHDAIIENCVSVARAKQKVASPEIIMLAMVKKGVDPVPSEQWIRDRKTELGYKVHIVKSKLNSSWPHAVLAARSSPCPQANATAAKLDRVWGKDKWALLPAKSQTEH